MTDAIDGGRAVAARRSSGVIVADDLTGAADACVAFVMRGLSGAVMFEASKTGEASASPSLASDGEHGAADVIAISTDSRGLPSSLAAARVGASVRRHAGASCNSAAPWIFKKIDSTLRGPVGAEIEAAMRAAGMRVAIVAPAFPAMGRIVERGLLRTTGRGTMPDIDIVQRLREEGMEGCVSVTRPPAPDAAEPRTRPPTPSLGEGELNTSELPPGGERFQWAVLPTEHLASPSERPAPPTEHLASPSERPAPSTEHLASPSERPAPPTEHFASSSERPAPPTEHLASSSERPAPPTEHLASPSERPAPSTELLAPRTEHLASTEGELKFNPLSPMSGRGQGEGYGPAWREALMAAQRRGGRVLVCDSVVQADLDAIVAAAAGDDLNAPILWAGAAGLAHALAAHVTGVRLDASAPAHETGPAPGLERTVGMGRRRGDVRTMSIVFAIGSTHPVTAAQQQRLLRDTTPIASAHVDDTLAIEHALALRLDIIVTLPHDAADAPVARFAELLLAREQAAPGSCALVMSGGDTAARLCRALGAARIDLDGEVAPGIPWGMLSAVAPRGRPVLSTGRSEVRWPLVLKAGGFGEDDGLIRVRRFLMEQHERS